MILVRAPLRIPLGGGGTDLPVYYSKFGGKLISLAIDKYVYVSLKRDSLKTSTALSYTDPFISHALKLLKINEGVKISSNADIPSGTGMGSSGAFLVALLKALHTFSGNNHDPRQLAEQAFEIEANLLKNPVGKQDHYIAAFGGLTQLIIDRKGNVEVNKLDISQKFLSLLCQSLVIFYTGIKRSSSEILHKQTKAIKSSNNQALESMHFIKKLGEKILNALQKGQIEKFGFLMDTHWQYKRKLSPSMTSPDIDKWYQLAKKAGAVGGKIMGAGGGGYLLFCCPGKKDKLRQSLSKEGLEELTFKFDFEGAKLLKN